MIMRGDIGHSVHDMRLKIENVDAVVHNVLNNLFSKTEVYVMIHEGL